MNQILKCNLTDEIFLKVPIQIYANEKFFTPSLLLEKETLNVEKNKWLKNCIHSSWVIKQDDTLLGRIAAAYNPDTKIGRIGFFDCNNYSSAVILHNNAIEFLRSYGAQIVEGPVNLGNKMFFWGCLSSCKRKILPGMNFHFPLIKKVFYENGYIEYYKSYVFYRSASFGLEDWVFKIAKRVKEQYPNLHTLTFQSKYEEKLVEDFVKVYNLAWQHFPDFTPMSINEVRDEFEKIKIFFDPNIPIFIYDSEKPVSFAIIIKNFTELLEDYYQKKGILKYLFASKLLFNRITQNIKTRTLLGIAVGTIPEYRSKGVETLIFEQLHENIYKTQSYEGLYFLWIGSFNPMFVRLLQNLGCEITHEYIVFRKSLKDDVKVQPHPVFSW